MKLLLLGRDQDVSAIDFDLVYYLTDSPQSSRKSVNCTSRLKRIADDNRSAYVKFTHQIVTSVSNRLRVADQEVNEGYFSEIASRRNEKYNSFQIYCTALDLKAVIKDYKIQEVDFLGVDSLFGSAIASVLDDAKCKLTILDSPRSRSNRVISFAKVNCFLRQARFLFCVVLAWLFSSALRFPIPSSHRRAFFADFPQHFSGTTHAIYGETYLESDYLLSLCADGTHQKMSIRQIIRGLLDLKRYKAEGHNSVVLESLLRPFDIVWFISDLLRQNSLLKFHQSVNFFLDGVDLREAFLIEANKSTEYLLQRRLFARLFQRYLKLNAVENFQFYLFEYPIGKIISVCLALSRPGCVRIGVQHGNASANKLLIYAAREELAEKCDYAYSFPRPSYVLCETPESAELYGESYRCQVMESVPRLKELSVPRFYPSNARTFVLYILGLHDGQLLLGHAANLAQCAEQKILIRPHPRSSLSNDDISNRFRKFENVRLSTEDLGEVLSSVHTVFGGYSGLLVQLKDAGYKVVTVNPAWRVPIGI